MDFDTIFQHAGEMVRQKLAASGGCHDFDHTMRVLHNAEAILAHTPEADRQITLLAALLHDIARPEEDAAKGKCCHAELGAIEAAALLEKLAAPPELSHAVAAAIATHRFRRGGAPQSIEAKILFDADKLDSLGAVGIGRAFIFAGKNDARVHNPREEALNNPPYSREDTAYREFLVKLQKIPARLFTPYAKKIALSRVAFMENFFDTLDQEM